MHAIAVGKLYNPKRRKWPEAITYLCRGGQHELLLFLAGPSAEEVAAVQGGEGAIALFVEQPVVSLVVRFGPEEGPGVPWSDAQFTIHLVPKAERVVPAPVERAKIAIVLVDADTGIVKAVRMVLVGDAFTAALHGAIAEQAALPWDEAAYRRKVAELQVGLPSAVMAKNSKHVALLAEKTR